MKKATLAVVIFILIISTAIVKNSAKKNEDKIFTTKENLRILNSKFKKIKLEYDYLSSAEKLLEYQFLYFEDELIQKDIENIKIFKTTNKIIQDLKITKEYWKNLIQKLLLKITKIVSFIKKMKQI